MQSMQVGFIGLGTMGKAMAHRLLGAGHEVLAWNRSAVALQELVDAGAQAAGSPQEVLVCEVSLSMLANDSAVEEILSESSLAGASGIHANMASISPETTGRMMRRFTSAGARYVAAPVLGRPHVAVAGELNILAGGNPKDIEALEPIFAVLGKHTWTIGPDPALANLVKIAVNYNIIHAIQALSESISLTEAAGLDAARFVDILSNTLFGGVVYRGYGDLIARKDYLPQAFSLDLGLKDLNLARGEAANYGVTLPTADLLGNILQKAIEDPTLRNLDWSAMAEVTRKS